MNCAFFKAWATNKTHIYNKNILERVFNTSDLLQNTCANVLSTLRDAVLRPGFSWPKLRVLLLQPCPRAALSALCSSPPAPRAGAYV